MPLDKKANAEPIRGYRLLEKLGSGGFGEVWKCEAPGGIFKAVKFVYGSLKGVSGDSARAEEELRAVQLIKSIRHPFLLSIDRVESVQGELIIVTELADHNLYELFAKYRELGRAGIPRDDLLGYLREAAEVLDLLNHKFDLQHLDIKPLNLFLVSNHVKVADFGLVNSLAGVDGLGGTLATGAVTPLYASPELFHGKLSRHCDQYSLALVYQELLTGKLPFDGKNTRQLLMQHTQTEPDLSALPDTDRPIVARALAKVPEERYPSCLDFVRALATGRPTPVEVERDMATTPGPNSAPTIVLPHVPVTARRSAKPALPADVLPDARILDCVSSSPLGEVWRAQVPDGRKKLVHVLFGLRSPEKALKEATARLRSVTHPALLAPEVAHVDNGRVILVTDAIRETLRDRFQQCQARKQPGVARGELVDYLRAAAEVLDYLYQQHGVQHLGLNPRALVLDHGWLQLAEFGFAQILWLADGQDVASRNLRYAAPELLDGKLSRHCDQYSLALLGAEMLTGVHPFGGQSPQVYLRRHGTPNLDRLPDLEREVFTRALRTDPHERWPSCTDMVLALEGSSPEVDQQLREKPDAFHTLLASTRDVRRPAPAAVAPDELNQVIADILAHAGGQSGAVAAAPPEVSRTDGSMHYRFQAGLPLGTARVKLEQFCRELGAEMRRQDDAGCVMRLLLPANFWQQWLGRQPGLEIHTLLTRVNPMSATPIDIDVCIRPLHASAGNGLALVQKTGADLLESLRQQFLVGSEKRVQDRLLWPHPVTVIPLRAGGEREEPIECRGKDISQTGLGFYLPHELDTAEVLIELPNAVRPPTITIPATLVRAKRCADGWYEIGAIFRLPALRRALEEVGAAAK